MATVFIRIWQYFINDLLILLKDGKHLSIAFFLDNNVAQFHAFPNKYEIKNALEISLFGF